jgi:hypothetical protein
MPRTQRKKVSVVTHYPTILEGMARGPWSCYWADQQEEAGESLSGQDVYAAAPSTPRWAERWAKKLASSIVSLNGSSLDDLYERAVRDGYSRDPEGFGLHLGMMATGSGLHWTDDVRNASFEIKVPSYEFWGPGCERSEPDARFV